jgi:hypothetical protein
MQVIGFNFTKISAEKFPDFKTGRSINNKIEFTNLEKDKIDLIKDSEVVKIFFEYSLIFTEVEKSDKKDAEIIFKGFMVLSLEKDEAKEILKSWKKKELPPSLKITLFNILLKKCAAKSLTLEEELGLPPHMAIPQLTPKPAEESA